MRHEIYISYFYKVRFMNSQMLPISTAKWDPKWFHNWRDQRHIFTDKNDVLNGIRFEKIMFPDSKWNELVETHEDCETCTMKTTNCRFMTEYLNYLRMLDFDEIAETLDKIAESYESIRKQGRASLVLLVHEPPSCKCCERPILIQWFNEHGVSLNELE